MLVKYLEVAAQEGRFHPDPTIPLTAEPSELVYKVYKEKLVSSGHMH